MSKRTKLVRERLDALQHAVHEKIQLVGGYWPPLAAVARLLEELGEVAELLVARADDRDLWDELIDVIIITTCLANQYCIRLHEWDAHYIGFEGSSGSAGKRQVPSAEWLGRLCIVAGQIGRAVNAYEGIKTPKEGSSSIRLGLSIAELHRQLLQMLSTHGVDGFERTKAVTATKAGRDSGRFQLGFDPSSAPSLSRFRTIQTQTLCPFARGARLWGAPAWDSSESIGGNAAEIAPVLVRFTSLLKWEVLDGFVVEVSDAALFRDLEGLAATFRTLLRELSAVDPWGSKSMDQEILAEDWQFEFNGARLFVAVFAPIYDGAHTRETYGENSAYILFQPEISFDRHLASTGRKHPAAHSQIRERFAAGGKPYDSQVITQPFEAPRYLKPLRQSDSSFEWWKDKT